MAHRAILEAFGFMFIIFAACIVGGIIQEAVFAWHDRRKGEAQ